MSEITNPISEAADILESAKDVITTVLEGNPSVLLMVSSRLTQTINRLNGMTGKQPLNSQKVDHPPITNFLGEEISVPQKIKIEDLTPEQADRQSFLTKVQALYAQFETLSPEGVLASYTIPEDQLLIRGVAKLAGVEEFEDRELNEEFIEDIQKAIKEKNSHEANESEVLKKIQSGDVTGNTTGKGAKSGKTGKANNPE